MLPSLFQVLQNHGELIGTIVYGLCLFLTCLLKISEFELLLCQFKGALRWNSLDHFHQWVRGAHASGNRLFRFLLLGIFLVCSILSGVAWYFTLGIVHEWSFLLFQGLIAAWFAVLVLFKMTLWLYVRSETHKIKQHLLEHQGFLDLQG